MNSKLYTFFIISIIIGIYNIDAIVPIGINMDGLVDWSNSMPYVNLVRQSRQWGPPSTPWDENATSDPITGWPTSDFGMVLISNAYDAGGRYLLTVKGNADVKLTVRFEEHIEKKNMIHQQIPYQQLFLYYKIPVECPLALQIQLVLVYKILFYYN